MIIPVLATTLFLFALYSFAAPAANSDASSDRSAVIAEIDGVRVTLGDLEQKRAADLFQAKTAFYQAERKALEAFIDDELLKRQAKRENLTVEQLLQQHVNRAVAKDPPEEALRIYYEGVETDEPYEKVRDKIIEHLRQRRSEKARTAYVKSLRSKANVTIALSPPKADLQLNEAPVRGGQRAGVTLVEYADYECPACQQIEPELKKLEAEYRGKVSFIYKDVPLPMHPHAQKAAEAARCANAQGKFWEYHDVLFDTKQLGVDELKRHARALNLDTTAFDKCLDSGEHAEMVKSQLGEAQKLGLVGTPSFFINGRLVSTGATPDALRRELDQELARVSSRPQQTATQ